MPEMVERDRAEPAIDESVDLGGIDPLGLVDALGKVAARTATSYAPGRLAELGFECLKIALGKSSVAPKPRDWRFSNRAWSEHPFYHRLMQTYLAWGETVERLVEDADLDWRTEERARFAASLLTSTVAPTNQPLLNPDALERAWETAGKSMVRGLRNFGLDVTTNNGLPRSIAPGAFEVGKTLATTPGAVVHANEVYELLQYNPSTPAVRARPVVVVPPQINKYYVMDLAPGRSFIEYARDRGFQIFAVSWRNPTPEQSGWGLGTYVDALGDAVRTANDIASSDGVSTVGACAGGITTAALLGHLAWTSDPLVRSAHVRGHPPGLRRAGHDRHVRDSPPGGPGARQVQGCGRARPGRPRGALLLPAAERPRLELLGPQQPDGRRAAPFRRARVELGRHGDPGGAARRLSRHVPAQLDGTVRDEAARIAHRPAARSIATPWWWGRARTTWCRGAPRTPPPACSGAPRSSSCPPPATSRAWSAPRGTPR